ncbi:hypothetical protein OpiT1DRAFT_05282 [Opitutaceae bacterium TAV1]|nr:hypothetical protein OpiT1DRAFT_05282 [Opitutaceae bacterium TAV1]
MRKAKQIRADILLHVAQILKNEVLNCDASDEDIDQIFREQKKLAAELERRAERLIRKKPTLEEYEWNIGAMDRNHP